MNRNSIVDTAKKVFADGPLGSWTSASSSPFGWRKLEFRADCTGTIEFSEMESPTSGPITVTKIFQWNTTGNGQIEINCQLENNDIDTRTIEYGFVVATDEYDNVALLITESKLCEIPNTLFYLHPPELAWVPDETFAELQVLIETDP